MSNPETAASRAGVREQDCESAHPPAEVVIGVDVGTTAAKVTACGLGGRWRTGVVREYPLLQPHPGWQVQDPRVVMAAAVGALADCVARVGGAHVVAISLSTAMHGLIGLDEHAQPLTPLLTWADARATEEARTLAQSGLGPTLHRETGTPVHSMSPLVKLAWMARHEPELAARVRTWVGLKDYLIATLTGTLATELSTASGTGMLDLRTRSWHSGALEWAGVSLAQLPTVLPTTAALGLSQALALRTGLPTATPVVVGAGDGPLGNLGTGALAPGVAGLSVGTSGGLRMIVPGPVFDLDPGLFCYALTDDLWAVGGAVSNGGSVVRWASDTFGAELPRTGVHPDDEGTSSHPDARLLALAESVPVGSDGLLVLPYLMGERAPLWDPSIPGAILGLRREHTRGHLARAFVEGVALQLSLVLDDVETVAPVTSIRATGGVFRSSLWRTVLASVLNRPLTVTGGADGTAVGACALGLFAIGRVPSIEAGLALLGAGVGACVGVGSSSEDDAATVLPDPVAVGRYEQVRAGVPGMLAQLTPVAARFAGHATKLAQADPPDVRGREAGA